MAAHGLFNNFTGGEWSPQLEARTDLQKYPTACKTLQNMRVLPWGGASLRGGTLFVAAARNASQTSRLVPFNFSTSVNYVIEMGWDPVNLGYFRFATNGVQLMIDYTTTPAWASSTVYAVGDYIHSTYNFGSGAVNILAVCIVGHTSGGSFATDYGAGKWAFIGSPGGTTPSTPLPYTISAPYGQADLFKVQVKELNDVAYFVHPNYPPYKLQRLGTLKWTMAEVAWKYPAMLDENVDGTTTLALSATTGSGVTMTSNADIFSQLHVGSYWEVKHQRNATKAEVSLASTGGTATSPSIKIKGDWTLVTTERWYGQLDVQRSEDGGSTWTTIRTFTSAADRNVNASGTQETEALFRLFYTANGDPYGGSVWSTGAPTSYVYARATLEVGSLYVAGLVKVTGFTDTKHVTVTVINAAESTAATKIWSEGAWSYSRGYPRAIGFFEQRLFFGGTIYRPNVVWGSVAADYENFAYSDLDDAAVAYQAASTQQNPIQWLESLQRIHAGSSGNELAIASGNTDEPITPSNVTIRTEANYGSEAFQALPVDNAILFVQRQGKRIRELKEQSIYADPNSATFPDLTILAEHLFSDGIVQMDYARLPDPTLFVVLGNGQLGVMTYNREQNITAWTKYVTDGSFESVACLYGSPADVAYVIVKRTINGSTKRYIEVFTAEVANKTSGVYMDCATAYDAGVGLTVTTLTGLSYLEGKAVQCVVDGNVVAGLTVTSGAVTFPAGRIIRVGLPYVGKLETMPVELQMANGTSLGRQKRLSELCIYFKDTLGCNYGNSDSTNFAANQINDEIPFRSTTDVMDSSPPLFTGSKIVPWNAGPDKSTRIVITQTLPMPMTVLAVAAKFEAFGA